MPDMPRTKFNSPWTVANIETELNGVKNARGSESLSDVLNSKAENATVTAAVAELSAGIGAVANAGAKNIVNNTANTTTVSAGITWTKIPDGSMSASGTSTGVSAVRVVGVQGSSTYASAVPIPKGRYIVSPSGFSDETYRIAIGIFADDTSSRATTNVYNSPYTFDITTDTARIDMSCVISRADITANGETFYPMIRRADIKDDTFVPYAPSNRELYEMILALQNGA